MLADDRIEVVSPGGLSSSITAEEYLSSKLSALRNRNLANVFYRLGFVEIFETEIIRIKPLYTEGLMKPDFEVSKNAIKIIIAPYIPFGKSKTTQLLKDMGEKGVLFDLYHTVKKSRFYTMVI